MTDDSFSLLYRAGLDIKYCCEVTRYSEMRRIARLIDLWEQVRP